MSTFLSRDVQQGLDRARADELKRKSRFRVQFDGEIYPILKLWDTGFVISPRERRICVAWLMCLTARHMSINV
jgi:hypothetical protein